MTNKNCRISHRFLVAGCGSIGQRHIANLKTLGVEQIFACDPLPERLSSISLMYNIPQYLDFSEALNAVLPDVVMVCTPPVLHIPQALAALRSGAHVFVEKPISHSLEDIDKVVTEAESRQKIVQVGYHLRYHPAIQKVKELIDKEAIGRVLWARAEYGAYLPDWRPWQDYRISYTAKRSMGGGIILDGSHEIDYMHWLLGEVREVFCLADKLSDLELDVEDTASLTLKFVSGCLGEIHIDCVQRIRSRSCKIVGTEGTLLWDSVEGLRLLKSSSTPQEWERLGFIVEPNDVYLKELFSFLDCIDKSTPPQTDALSAKRVLEIALAAKASSLNKQMINLKTI